MIDIQWKGKIGYGDIVSPICYAHNISFKFSTPVRLTFRWGTSVSHKFNLDDPETLRERASYIDQLCVKKGTRVELIHSDEGMKENHTNYDWSYLGKDNYHNYWFPQKINQCRQDLIVVNPTIGNVLSLTKYGKSWKDILENQWPEAISRIPKKYEVICVDYRTPIADLMDLLAVARGFVGYHGTASWLARFMHTPSILFSSGGKLTRGAHPYAVVFDNENSVQELHTIDTHLNKSRVNGARFKARYITYKPEFEEHLVHEKQE